jgi:hypothetical protein
VLAWHGLSPEQKIRATVKVIGGRVYTLAEAAEKHWRRLDGRNQLPKVILGIKFADGLEVVRSQDQAAAA